MRDHPEGIRSLVLDSVLPTTYTVPANWWNTRAGFDNLFQACVAEPACNAANPHLEETFKEDLYKYIAGIVRNEKHKLLAINGMPDHTHLLVGLKPDMANLRSGWKDQIVFI